MNDHVLRVYDSILGLLSNEDNPTPLVRLHKTVPFKHTAVYAKLEWYNPFGAVKDRIGANMLMEAEEKGVVQPGKKKLVEPTSGNTGLGLAMMANAKGYSLRTPLSKKIPLEKRAVLRFFGSDVIELDDELCPAPGAPEGAIAIARQMGMMPAFHMLDQYRNEANPNSHYKTTGPEIWKQTQGKITHFVAGLGTCGTITGNGRFLKEKNPKVKVHGVHPQEGHDIPGVRSYKQLAQTELFREKEYDGLTEVTNDEAYSMCLRLVREECIIAGPSSGMALSGALKLIPDEPGNVVVVIFPDNIFKYASSVMKHFPDMFPKDEGEAPAAKGPSATEQKLFMEMLANAKTSPDSIPVSDAAAMIEKEKALVIDVRSKEKFQQQHVAGAVNIPLQELSKGVETLPKDKNAAIVTVCALGNISIHGMLYLKALGYRNVKSIAGGTTAWAEKGLPVEPR
jgi:cysteine synthase/rhodanese-related sulfurtransferase